MGDMGTGNFYHGTSVTQDGRFCNKDKKLLNSRSWPDEFDKRVNIKKVKAKIRVKVEMNVIRDWADKRVTELLGMEDEVVSNLVISELEAENQDKGPCPKRLQLLLTGSPLSTTLSTSSSLKLMFY